jgi:hypothetical protein
MTPFMVVFCHIITHPFASQQDLQLLGDFVATLEQLFRFSEGMAKLHKLCDTFCKVASLYVRAKYSEAAQKNDLQPEYALNDSASGFYGQPVVDDIDNYLLSMGLLPPSMATEGQSSEIPGDAAFDPSFLNDWYQGNSSLMGLLEQDLPLDGYGLMDDVGS